MKTGISLDSLELSMFKKKLIHFKKKHVISHLFVSLINCCCFYLLIQMCNSSVKWGINSKFTDIWPCHGMKKQDCLHSG